MLLFRFRGGKHKKSAFSPSTFRELQGSPRSDHKYYMKELTNTEQDAWIAGILEGEGCFNVTKRKQVRITCSMTDLDVIERLHRYIGKGYILTDKQRGHYKRQYRWWCCNGEDILEILDRVQPYMGQRRLARIQECIEVIQQRKPRKKRPQ